MTSFFDVFNELEKATNPKSDKIKPKKEKDIFKIQPSEGLEFTAIDRTEKPEEDIEPEPSIQLEPSKPKPEFQPQLAGAQEELVREGERELVRPLRDELKETGILALSRGIEAVATIPEVAFAGLEAAGGVTASALALTTGNLEAAELAAKDAQESSDRAIEAMVSRGAFVGLGMTRVLEKMGVATEDDVRRAELTDEIARGEVGEFRGSADFMRDAGLPVIFEAKIGDFTIDNLDIQGFGMDMILLSGVGAGGRGKGFMTAKQFEENAVNGLRKMGNNQNITRSQLQELVEQGKKNIINRDQFIKNQTEAAIKIAQKNGNPLTKGQANRLERSVAQEYDRTIKSFDRFLKKNARDIRSTGDKVVSTGTGQAQAFRGQRVIGAGAERAPVDRGLRGFRQARGETGEVRAGSLGVDQVKAIRDFAEGKIKIGEIPSDIRGLARIGRTFLSRNPELSNEQLVSQIDAELERQFGEDFQLEEKVVVGEAPLSTFERRLAQRVRTAPGTPNEIRKRLEDSPLLDVQIRNRVTEELARERRDQFDNVDEAIEAWNQSIPDLTQRGEGAIWGKLADILASEKGMSTPEGFRILERAASVLTEAGRVVQQASAMEIANGGEVTVLGVVRDAKAAVSQVKPRLPGDPKQAKIDNEVDEIKSVVAEANDETTTALLDELDEAVSNDVAGVTTPPSTRAPSKPKKGKPKTEAEKIEAQMKKEVERLTKRVGELERKIAERDIAVEPRIPKLQSEELTKLRTRVSDLNKELSKIRREETKVTKTLEEKESRELEKIEKRISELDKKISEGDVGVPKKEPSLDTPKLREARKRRDELNKQLSKLRAEKNKKPDKTEKQKVQEEINKLQKRVDELKGEIKRGEVDAKKREPKLSSPELTKLRAERDKLNKEKAAIRKARDADPEKAKQIRLDREIEKTKSRIAELRGKIERGDLEAKKKEPKITSPELQKLREERKELNDELRKLRTERDKPSPEVQKAKRLEDLKKKAQERIDELEGQVAARDVSKKEREPQLTDPELTSMRQRIKDLNKERAKIRREIARANRPSLTDAEIVSERIAKMTDDKKIKDKDENLLVKELVKIAKKAIPSETKKKNPIEILANAVQDREKFRDVWQEAQDILEIKFAGKPEVLEKLDPYFRHTLDIPLDMTQLNTAIRQTMKDEGAAVRDLIDEHFTSVNERAVSLADKITAQTNLNAEGAQVLADAVINRFNQMVSTSKRRRLLARVKASGKPVTKKTLSQADEFIRLNNQGAFDDSTFIEFVEQKLGFDRGTVSEAKLREFADLAHRYQIETDPIKKRDIRLKILNEMANLAPKWQRAMDNLTNIFNLQRALVASWDLSAAGIQGFMVSIANPGEASVAMKNMFTAINNEEFAKEIQGKMLSDPEIVEGRNLGLEITEFGEEAPLRAKEELFQAKWISKIPGLKTSERTYVVYLNTLRSGVYKSALEAHRSTTGEEMSQFDKQGMVRVINTLTGRGFLPKKMESIIPLLNTVFFSTRLNLSILQTPWVAFTEKSLVARKKAQRDISIYAGLVTGVLAMASLAGFDIETDPTSSNFGTIKLEDDSNFPVLNSSHRTFINLVARSVLQRRKTMSGEIKKLDGTGVFPETRGTVAGKYVRNKLSPGAGTAWTFYKGQDPIGRPADFETVVRAATPITWQEFYDTTKELGLPGLLYAPAIVFGRGPSVFEKKFTREREERESLREKEKQKKAEERERKKTEKKKATNVGLGVADQSVADIMRGLDEI